MSKKLEFINIENKDFINQYFYRYKILENEFENFKNILINYIKDMNKRENENEDSLVANCLSPFFKKLDFETHVKYKMKGKSEIDLAILKDSDIQVIIEAKKPNDKDFFYAENPNCKALHEAILYYFRIRKENNSSIKYIILTDFYKFYIFEAKEFENGFYKNKDFEKLYKSFTNKNSIFDGRTEEFYLEAKKILDLKNFALKGAFIDLNEIIKTDLSQALSAIALDYDTINIEAGETAEINFKYAYGGSRYSSLMSFRVISDSGEENVAVAYTLLHTLIPKPEPVKDESAIIAKGEESKSNSEKNTKDN